jgi:hypothetical protein
MGGSSNGVATSNAAAVSISGAAGALRARVLHVITELGGATCDEVECVTDLKHQTASARVYELHTRGKIVDSGERRATRSGRDAIVWVVPEPERCPRPLLDGGGPCALPKGHQ